MKVEFKFPLKGLNESTSYEAQPPLTSPYMQNVRPLDVEETRARGGQRPGLKKYVPDQIGGAAKTVNALCWVALGNTESLGYETRLVAVGSDTNDKFEVWYEDQNGSMIALTDSELTVNDDLGADTRIAMVPAFQKVFIFDKNGYRIVDFVNTRIKVDTALTNTPSRGAEIYQGPINAKMLVDYIWTDGASVFICGYNTTGTFDTSHDLKLSSDNSTVASAGDIKATNEPPHWNKWMPYNGDGNLAEDDTSFGSMPQNANIGCRYRGRIVLSGNSVDPHQWYMTRQANPFDWAYTANDAQSPVAGGNAEVGKCPDIVTALIPYSDDYLITGGVTDTYIMKGDPAAGGMLDDLSTSSGVFGPKSWCISGDGVLFYAGTTGINKLTIGASKPEPLSHTKLPEIFEGIDRYTHRISMAFDPARLGFNLFVTDTSTGKGTCYWYEVRTDGFFPEVYLGADEANSSAPYCAIYYDHPDGVFRGLVAGFGDGYIRTFDNGRANDEGASSNVKITGYVMLTPVNLSG